MSCADKPYSTLNHLPTAIPLGIWPNWPSAVWRLLCQVVELRRQRRALLDLDDRQLADVGVTREQALQEASKLFWTRV